MKPFINDFNDLMTYLDNKTEGVNWNTFYTERRFPTPFITQNDMPDEGLVQLLEEHPTLKSMAEFGCGEGRNAIYAAKQGLDVTACDLSPVAIHAAQDAASKQGAAVNFLCGNIFETPLTGQFDCLFDSGLMHHLSPHRRLQYLAMLKDLLAPGGFIGLTCFAWGENCADEIDDWTYYTQPFNAGMAFTKERLYELFTPHFDVVEIRHCKDGLPGTIQGMRFMWFCLLKHKNA